MDQGNPDMALGVEFYVKATEDMRATKEAGRPIYKDVEMCKIVFPADNKRELHVPAHQAPYIAAYKRNISYAERFQGAYDAFKKNQQAEHVSGTPISELPILTEAKRAELRGMDIRTVEQLAGLPDPAMKRIGMGARDLVNAAKDYLSKAEGLSEIAALKAEIEALKAGAPSGPVPDTEAEDADADDQFAGMTTDDLKNMIRDAGGEVPRGRAGRKTLVEVLEKIAEAKQKDSEAA